MHYHSYNDAHLSLSILVARGPDYAAHRSTVSINWIYSYVQELPAETWIGVLLTQGAPAQLPLNGRELLLEEVHLLLLRRGSIHSVGNLL